MGAGTIRRFSSAWSGWWTTGRNCVLVLCRRRAHFATLRWMLDKAGISHAAIFGSHSVRDRTEAKRQLSEGNVKVLLLHPKSLAEGEDLPGLGRNRAGGGDQRAR